MGTMDTILIHSSGWVLMLVVALLTGMVGLCVGIPGRSRIKTTLGWLCMIWAILDSVVVVFSTLEVNQVDPPAILEILNVMLFQLLILNFTGFLYAMADKERGLHYRIVQIITVVSIVIHASFDYFHDYQGTGRLWLPAINQMIGWGGALTFLVVAYRRAPKGSTRRVRGMLVFGWFFFNIFCVWIPVQVVGETLGLIEDKILVFAYTQVLAGISFVAAFGLVLLRYNLVKVELDQVGEGLFRDIDSPVLLLSKNHAILRANPKAEEVFELAEIMGEAESDRAVTRVIPDFKGNAAKFGVDTETQLGHREFECTHSKVYQKDEELGSLLIFHDVTRERELARMKTEFTSTVSHELRTPLTSILGFAKIIERRFRDVLLPKVNTETKKEERAVKQIQTNLGVIISESNRLTALINDVLDISKMEAGKIDWHFAKCDPRTIIQQAINATNGLFANKPQVGLEQVIPDDLPEVVADSDRVVQVVINLISNAVKFTDEGAITISAEKSWSSITVKVRDPGAGISAENQKLVFEKYKQVGEIDSDKPKGTGLGLPISKEIVEFHGGRIWVESVLGEGSTFCFTLPLANVTDSVESTIDVTELALHLEKMEAPVESTQPTVLIVDDEPAIREMLKQLFEEQDYGTLEASDGVMALEVLRQESPDLVILDVMMPRLNGFDCAAAIKADRIGRHIPIVMLTVLDDAQRAFGLGVDAYLTKPFEAGEILTAVKRLLTTRMGARNVVVYGDREGNEDVFELLAKSRVEWTHVTSADALKAAMETSSPGLALVLRGHHETAAGRAEVQRIVGASPCLLFCLGASDA